MTFEASRAATTAPPWRPTLSVLLVGNVVTGMAVLAPAGMLDDLAAGLAVSVRETGLLVTFGAVVLCIASPVTAWLTATMDRRLLLSASLLGIAVGHLATAFVASYPAVLAIRLVMLAAAAIFTPQAASAVTLMVPAAQRSTAISYVFLGWSLSIAAGLPAVTLVATHLGWRAVYAMLGGFALLTSLAVLVTVPAALRSAPLVMRSWMVLAGNGLIVRLLSITALWMSGYFAIFTYLRPSLAQLGGASTPLIAAAFATVGLMGFIGNLAATRMIGPMGGFNTALVFMLALAAGAAAWATGSGSLPMMLVGAALLGLGFAAFNSVTQARLVAAIPALAGASVALNTSCVYVGQAIGSGLAVWLYAHSLLVATGYGAVAFMLAALAILAQTRTRPFTPA